MDRVTFSKRIVELLHTMSLEEEDYLIDYALRSAQEQNRLFKEGKSKCDGYNIISAHQKGKALDVYFVEENKLVDPKAGWEYWHNLWIKRGGQPMIEWDKGHFE